MSHTCRHTATVATQEEGTSAAGPTHVLKNPQNCRTTMQLAPQHFSAFRLPPRDKALLLLILTITYMVPTSLAQPRSQLFTLAFYSLRTPAGTRSCCCALTCTRCCWRSWRECWCDSSDDSSDYLESRLVQMNFESKCLGKGIGHMFCSQAGQLVIDLGKGLSLVAWR